MILNHGNLIIMTYKQYNRHVKLCKLNNKPLDGVYLSIKQHLDKVTKDLKLIKEDKYGNDYNLQGSDLRNLFLISHKFKTILCYRKSWEPLETLNINYNEIRKFIRNKLLTVPIIKELNIEKYYIGWI